jgi:glycosyltransferase involved in cell wall biosynthesis
VSRVLLLNQYYWPDLAPTAQLSADLGMALAERGHQVTAVASARPYSTGSGIELHPLFAHHDGVRILRVPSTALGRAHRLNRLIDYTSFLTGALPLALAARPEIVIALSTPPLIAALGLVLRRILGARLIAWVMDLYPDVALKLGAIGEGAGARALRRLASQVASQADALVALDDAMRRRLIDQGAPPEKVAVIDNWADGERIRPLDAASHPLRRRMALNGVFTVSYSGNMGLGHDFETLLDAMARLKDESIQFLFFGDGPRRESLSAGCRAGGLRAQFLPYQAREELPLTLTAADASLVTLGEGLAGLVVPSKLYGILAAGLPVLYVGPDEGRCAEVVAEGAGVRVANGDGAGLADAIRRLAAEPGERARMGRRAREIFDGRFSRGAQLRRHVELIERC